MYLYMHYCTMYLPHIHIKQKINVSNIFIMKGDERMTGERDDDDVMTCNIVTYQM